MSRRQPGCRVVRITSGGWQFYRQTHSERAINNALIAYLRSLSPRLTTRCSGLPLSDSVRAGQAVFAQSGCKTCHSAPFCRNGQQPEVAAGRSVRTPTLRNLPLTPPYLADSSAPTLEDVQNTSFHARQRALSPVDVRRITQFLKPTEPVQ